MATSLRSAPDDPRALAVAIHQDFQALSELFSARPIGRAELREAAPLKATVDRGLRLAEQLLAAIDAETDR